MPHGLTFAEQRAVITSLYQRAGVTAHWDLRLLPSGVVYEQRQVALGCHHLPTEGMHDLAHFLVAPGMRKDLRNFGLGPFPGGAFESCVVPVLVGFDVVYREECLAAILAAKLVLKYLPSEHDNPLLEWKIAQRATVEAYEREMREMGLLDDRSRAVF